MLDKFIAYVVVVEWGRRTVAGRPRGAPRAFWTKLGPKMAPLRCRSHAMYEEIKIKKMFFAPQDVLGRQDTKSTIW